MGVATDSSGELNTPWGRANDHGIVNSDIGQFFASVFSFLFDPGIPMLLRRKPGVFPLKVRLMPADRDLAIPNATTSPALLLPML